MLHQCISFPPPLPYPAFLLLLLGLRQRSKTRENRWRNVSRRLAAKKAKLVSIPAARLLPRHHVKTLSLNSGRLFFYLQSGTASTFQCAGEGRDGVGGSWKKKKCRVWRRPAPSWFGNVDVTLSSQQATSRQPRLQRRHLPAYPHPIAAGSIPPPPAGVNGVFWCWTSSLGAKAGLL